MRNLIFTRTQRFDLNDFRDRIEEVREAFDRYLDTYPVRNPRTKHSLMGPVGKVIQEARTGKWDAASLAGYALNIHLASRETGGVISDPGRRSLEEGVKGLLALLKEVPVTAQDKLLARVDYGVYYLRRKKGLARLEAIRQAWIAFLKERYESPGRLAEAWGEDVGRIGEEFQDIAYPSRAAFGRAAGQKRADMGQFTEQAKLKGYERLDEEGEEE